MAGMIQLNIRDGITPDLQRRLDLLRDTRPILAAAGKALEVALISEFRRLDREHPNKMGWPRQHFWNRRVAQKTMLTAVDARSATVSVSSPEFMHWIQGGTITPKRGKTLAIPANGEAYALGGPRASGRDYQFLLLAQGNLVGALLKPETYKIKGHKMQGGEVMYWLVRSVTQAADPSVDPGQNESMRTRISAAVSRAVTSALNRIIGSRH